MAIYYFDTSALAKRYIVEAGTNWVVSITDPAAGHLINIASIAGVELISAITRRQRGGSLSLADATNLAANVKRDLKHQYLSIDLTSAIVQRAMLVAETHGLRGYDAVHLAASQELRIECIAKGTDMVLVSSDDELKNAALIEGLVVDDPRTHP